MLCLCGPSPFRSDKRATDAVSLFFFATEVSQYAVISSHRVSWIQFGCFRFLLQMLTMSFIRSWHMLSNFSWTRPVCIWLQVWVFYKKNTEKVDVKSQIKQKLRFNIEDKRLNCKFYNYCLLFVLRHNSPTVISSIKLFSESLWDPPGQFPFVTTKPQNTETK